MELHFDRRRFITKMSGASLLTTLLKPVNGIALPPQRSRPLQSSINGPMGILASADRLIVSEYVGGRLIEIDLKSNWLQALCGDPQSICPRLQRLKYPRTVASTKAGEFYVVERGGILCIEPDRCTARYVVQTDVRAAPQLRPVAAVVDGKGAVYWTDGANRLFQSVGGRDTLLLDSNAGLKSPKSLAVMPDGDLVIAGSLNHRVYRFAVASRKLDVIAGTGAFLSNGDGGPAVRADLRMPMTVTVDAKGNVFVAEHSRVRMIRATDSTILTIAGGGREKSSSNDGIAIHSTVGTPFGLAVVGSQLYITDSSSNVIRAVNLGSGTIKTIAGNGLPHRPTTLK